jgi:hypothetical protein
MGRTVLQRGWLALEERERLSALWPSPRGQGLPLMADCPECGAPILFAALSADPGGRLALDSHEAASGPGRYAIWDDGYCRPVAAGAQVLAHPLHACRPPLPR